MLESNLLDEISFIDSQGRICVAQRTSFRRKEEDKSIKNGSILLNKLKQIQKPQRHYWPDSFTLIALVERNYDWPR